MSEHSELIEKLQKQLSHEHDTRRKQQELNEKLQHEYDVLLKKLAEAELHIDKLRLGANVEMNKWYLLRYSTEQNSTLRQRLEAQFGPSNRAPTESCSSAVATHGGGTAPHASLSSPHTKPREKEQWLENSSHLAGSGITGDRPTTYDLQGNANTGNTVSNAAFTPYNNEFSCHESVAATSQSQGNQDGVLQKGPSERANTGVEGSCSQLSLLHLSSHSSSAHLTDSDELCISQMSAGTIATCGSAESMLLAHLLQLHNLQEQIAALKSKINDGAASLDEILADLSHIQNEHRTLSEDVDTTSGHLETLREKYNGKDFAPIARSRDAVIKELAKLSEELQDLGELIQTKALELSQRNTVPPSSSATESVLQSQMGKQGADSDSHLSAFFDSLNSPALPMKYLSQDMMDSPLVDQQLTTGPVIRHNHSASGDNKQGHTQSSSSINRDHPSNVKSSSSVTGTPLEDLLDMSVGGRGLRVESCEDTLSDLSDILPSDDNSRVELLEDIKPNLDRNDKHDFGNGYSKNSQSPLPHTPLTTSLASVSPLPALGDQDKSSTNPLHTLPSLSHRALFQHSTPTSHHQDPHPGHIPLSTHSPQPLMSAFNSAPSNNSTTLPSPLTTHAHETVPSPFPRTDADSGFAGSEFPSRAGKRDANDLVSGQRMSRNDSIPYQQLVEESSGEGSLLREASTGKLSNDLVEAPNEEEKKEVKDEEKRPSITIAAIDSLRNELASLKEQILQTVQQQKDYDDLQLESLSRSPFPDFNSREPRCSSATSATNTTTHHPSTVRHWSSTNPLITTPSNVGGEDFFTLPHQPTSVTHVQPPSVKSTPKRPYIPSSHSNSAVTATSSKGSQDPPLQYPTTPARTVTPLTTPIPTPHHVGGDSSYNRSITNTGSNTHVNPQEQSQIVVQPMMHHGLRSSSLGHIPSLAGDGFSPEWPSTSGGGGHHRTCPAYGEDCVQVSNRERTNEDGSRETSVTYAHTCRRASAGTPSHKSRRIKDRVLNMKTASPEETGTIEGESVMTGDRDYGGLYQVKEKGRSSAEDKGSQTAPSTPSRFSQTSPGSVYARSGVRVRSRTSGRSERERSRASGLRERHPSGGDHHHHATRFTSTPTRHSTRPDYPLFSSKRETCSSSSSAHSSPVYGPPRSTHTSPLHPFPDPHRRGSSPITHRTTVPSNAHHAGPGVYYTPSLKREAKLHHYPLSTGSNRYKTKYTHAVPADREHPQMMHTSHKPSARGSSTECSPEYYTHTPQHRATGQRSKLRRKLVRLVPTVSTDEVYYSEPSSRSKRVRRRKRRYEERGDAVRGGGVRDEGVMGVYVKPRPVYVVEGDEYSSGSEEDIEVDAMELEEILKLAKELKRRSRRIQTTLQTELSKRDAF